MSEVKTKGVAHATQAATVATHSDERGRLIAVKKLNALNYYNLAKAMGDTASNEVMMQMAMIAAAVTRIDTQDYAFPASEQDVQFLIQTLDFDGIAAAGEALKKLAPKIEAEKEIAKN